MASTYNDYYERQVFSIVQMFAQLGGIYNSLFTIGFLFCGAFNYNLFLSSIISKLFYFKARFDSEISHKKDKKKDKDKREKREIKEHKKTTEIKEEVKKEIIVQGMTESERKFR